jgi:hypothetical protein
MLACHDPIQHRLHVLRSTVFLTAGGTVSLQYSSSAAASAECCVPQPFFSLSGAELSALGPLVAGVSGDTLKAVVPLLAQQRPATVGRMLAFLKGVSGKHTAVAVLKVRSQDIGAPISDSFERTQLLKLRATCDAYL